MWNGCHPSQVGIVPYFYEWGVGMEATSNEISINNTGKETRKRNARFYEYSLPTTSIP